MSEVQTIKEFLNFLSSSPSAFHSVENAEQMLMKNGFKRLSLGDEWKFTEGGRYFTSLNGTALVAFINSSSKNSTSFKVIGAHTDSPGIKIKPNPEFIKEGFLQLNTEIYGGPILSTWFDRPLSMAGRVFLKGHDAFSPIQKLINLRDPIAIIPNLAIHMNREVNNGYQINNQKDMIPVLIAGLEEKANVSEYLLKMIAGELKVSPKDVLDFELFLYESDEAKLIGAEKDLISSSRIDNLEAVYAGLEAIIDARADESAIKILACYDNEEVGSATKQGADSMILLSIVQRILEANNSYSPEKISRAIANSFMISVDGAHSIHPNKTEKYDPMNKPQINKGPVIKMSANQRYSTDSQSSSVIKSLAEKAKVPVQVFVNNSNEKGGSTIGPISGKYMPLKSADIGVPMLAMHSIRELAGVKDHLWMVKLLKEFYS